MAHKISRKWKRAGFTLITALAFSLIIGTVLAGVGTVSLSHLSRSESEGNYANAVAAADAGINYELAWISKNPNLNAACGASRTPGCFDQTPFAVPSPGIPGQPVVYVTKWDSTLGCTNSPWPGSPNDMCIRGTGTVNGVSRTVEARGTRKSAFDQYAIYAYQISVINGAGASGATSVVGNMGSNGPVTINGSLGSQVVQGTLSLNGPGATPPISGSNVAINPDAVTFPTVSQVANTMFPGGGLTWLQTHNANASIMMLKSADPTLASVPTVAGFTLAQVNSKLTTAGFTAASRSLGSAPLATTNDTSALDVATTGTRFAMPSTPYAPAIGANTSPKGPVYFFPPGDYYLSDMNFLGKGTWVMLTHLGDIRIWVDSNSSSGDDISKLNVIFSDSTSSINDPKASSKFRLYYNKCATLKMDGGGLFSGSVYAIKSGCANGPGVYMEGNNEILGSVIANSITLGGNSNIVFPNNGNDNGNDPSLWYGFKDNWKELPWQTGTTVSGGTVFADGTSN